MCNNIIGRKLFAANSMKGVALRAPIVGGACESQSALGNYIRTHCKGFSSVICSRLVDISRRTSLEY